MTTRTPLAELQDICRGLPDALETKTFGHPTFQAGPKRTFAVLDDHEQPDMLCLVCKLEPGTQSVLVDGRRFFLSKFGAQHGWTSMRVDEKTDWVLARRLVLESYRRVAPKRSILALDALQKQKS